MLFYSGWLTGCATSHPGTAIVDSPSLENSRIRCEPFVEGFASVRFITLATSHTARSASTGQIDQLVGFFLPGIDLGIVGRPPNPITRAALEHSVQDLIAEVRALNIELQPG